MTTADIKALLDAVNPEDKGSVNTIKSFINAKKDDAEKELKSVTNEAIQVLQQECHERILAAIEERDSATEFLKAQEAEEAAALKAERDRNINFFATAKQLVETLKRSEQGLPVQFADSFEPKLASLTKYGFDIKDDATIALLFSQEVCGSSAYNIKSYKDFQTELAKVEERNKDFSVKQASEKAVPAFQAIGEAQKTITTDMPVEVSLTGENGTEQFADVWQEESYNESYYDELTSALSDFKSQMNAAAEKVGRRPSKVYYAFFKAAADNGIDTDLTSKTKFEAYEADLIAEAKELDIQYITDLYQDMSSLSYESPSYDARIQTNIVSIQDQIAAVSERYGLSKDEVITAAFAKQSITTEADLNKRLLADSFDINVRSIVNGIHTLKVAEGASVEDTLKTAQSVDLSEKRLKAAGVSNDNIETITGLKSDFITALSKGEPTREIEMALGTAAINAQSDMVSRQINRTYPKLSA
ncbi:MAG: hypothetical protein CL561_11100 [Alphaproteobacteria bacterium]|nr:hypothetical protein [Alphaproteobacteria bacterium]|tara:strand:+ start:8000 stop:9421 length:1422 start_codon:yes stop_codon:yes gene_type:complete